MELLVQQGKILYVGSSNFAGIDIIEAQCSAKERHFMGLVSEQSLYNLTARTIGPGGYPGLPAFRPGVDTMEPVGRRASCRRTGEGKPGTSFIRAYSERIGKETQPAAFV